MRETRERERQTTEWAIIWGWGLRTSAPFLCLLPSGFPRTGLLGSSLNKRSGDPSLIRTGAIKRAGAGGVDCSRDGLLATRSYGSRGARSGFVLAKRDTQWWSSRCGSRPRAPCQKADATSLSSCSSDSMHYLHSALVLVKCLL